MWVFNGGYTHVRVILLEEVCNRFPGIFENFPWEKAPPLSL